MSKKPTVDQIKAELIHRVTVAQNLHQGTYTLGHVAIVNNAAILVQRIESCKTESNCDDAELLVETYERSPF